MFFCFALFFTTFLTSFETLFAYKDQYLVNQHGFNQRKHGYYDDPLVTGGHEPQPHSYPFVAMMLYHEGFLDHPERKCGGSILNENWILTSAQCCKDLPGNES